MYYMSKKRDRETREWRESEGGGEGEGWRESEMQKKKSLKMIVLSYVYIHNCPTFMYVFLFFGQS